jgi:hypothetical protein
MKVFWGQVAMNAAAVAGACAGFQHFTGMGGAAWGAWGAGIGMCVLANLAGLAQQQAIGGSSQAGK